jgi:hypothetical protein
LMFSLHSWKWVNSGNFLSVLSVQESINIIFVFEVFTFSLIIPLLIL